MCHKTDAQNSIVSLNKTVDINSLKKKVVKDCQLRSSKKKKSIEKRRQLKMDRLFIGYLLVQIDLPMSGFFKTS